MRCGDKVGEQITGDQTWRFTDREVGVDLLPFCEMFRHFLWALPLDLTSEGLEVVASERICETWEMTDDVVGIG